MAFNPNIQLGPAPLLWSDMNEVLVQINQNFDTLSAGGGGGPVNFNTLDTNVSPTIDDLYTLGTTSNQWKTIHVSEYSAIPGNELNGLWIGTAQIKGASGIIDLPVGATVAGNLIIDPTKTAFKTITVAGQSNVVADSFTDILTLGVASGISITTDAGSDTITFANTGILSVAAGTGITASTMSGVVTITNNGIRTLSTGTPVIGRAAGAGISVSGTNDAIITNTGILDISTGFGLTSTVDDATGIASISVNTGSITTNAFKTILVSGQSDVVADSAADTLSIASGYGIVITTNAGTDTIWFALDQKHLDINGSIFGNDSTLLVDGTDGKIVGPVYTSTLRTSETQLRLGYQAGLTSQGASSVAIGNNAGTTTQGASSVTIGNNAGTTTQGADSVAIGNAAGNLGQGTRSIAIGSSAGANSQSANAIAIGYAAGGLSQGNYAVAIGYDAGSSNQPANTIILNASGSGVNGVASQTNSFYVAPIRNAAGVSGVLQYDSTTKEVSYSSTISGTSFTGNIFTNLIDSADSSAITVTPATIFSSDVDIENDLTVKGSKVINLLELKSVVAASISFSDFQTKIAALV